MASVEYSQRNRLLALFGPRNVMRASELKDAGITPTAIARAVEDGEIERVSRGLYQRCRVDVARHHALAVASMRVPKGIVTMLSALAYHGLMDEEHPRVWMALGPHDWAPGPSCPPLRILRFAEPYLRQGVEHHAIGGVNVPIYGLAKTLADVFRHPRLVARATAAEALRRAVRERKVGLEALERNARTGSVWTIMRPYLDSALLRA